MSVLAVIAWVQNVWAAFSFVSALVGGIGLALAAAALFVGPWLPSSLRKLFLAAGLLFVSHAAILQYGHTQGAQEATQLAVERAVAAERERAGRAVTITRNQSEKLARERAENQRLEDKLKDLERALSKRADADRVCVDRDLSRRLRNL